MTDTYGNKAVTNTVTLRMGKALKIIEPPQDSVAQIGEMVSFSVVAEGEVLTYQWYVKSSKSATFSKSSIIKETYRVTMTKNHDGNQLYCVVFDAYCNLESTRVVTIKAR